MWIYIIADCNYLKYLRSIFSLISSLQKLINAFFTFKKLKPQYIKFIFKGEGLGSVFSFFSFQGQGESLQGQKVKVILRYKPYESVERRFYGIAIVFLIINLIYIYIWKGNY